MSGGSNTVPKLLQWHGFSVILTAFLPPPPLPSPFSSSSPFSLLLLSLSSSSSSSSLPPFLSPSLLLPPSLPPSAFLPLPPSLSSSSLSFSSCFSRLQGNSDTLRMKSFSVSGVHFCCLQPRILMDKELYSHNIQFVFYRGFSSHGLNFLIQLTSTLVFHIFSEMIRKGQSVEMKDEAEWLFQALVGSIINIYCLVKVMRIADISQTLGSLRKKQSL